MTVRRILTIPDPILRTKSNSVKKVDKDIKNLMRDMLETMYDAPGIGLAAIQIGVAKRVVVMDVSKETDKKEPMYFVNPEITWKSNTNATYEEGACPYQISLQKLKDQISVKLNIWTLMEWKKK